MKKTGILFINPKTDVNPELPNLQLVYSATIEEKKGKDAKIIDLNSLRENEERYLDKKSEKLLISIRPFSKKESDKIIKNYLKKYPKTKAYSVTGIIDVLCCYNFLDSSALKEKKIQTIKYDEEFGDNIPFPNYELLDSIEVFKENWKTGKWNYPIMTSLGCPYQCIYCSSRNRKWKSRSPKNCYDELKAAKKKYDFQQFSLLDDVFNLDKERAIEFCNLVKKLNVRWLCTNGLRADRFDEKLAKAMSESGCVHVGFGAESYNQEILDRIKKRLTTKQLDSAVDVAKKYFKGVHVFFIIGLPSSSYESDLESLKWAIKKRVNAHFSYFVPFDEHYGEEGFYGESAKPVSEAYSKNLQEKIYKMTSHMRGDYDKGFFHAVVERLRLIWLFDRKNIFSHIFDYLKKKIE